MVFLTVSLTVDTGTLINRAWFPADNHGRRTDRGGWMGRFPTSANTDSLNLLTVVDRPRIVNVGSGTLLRPVLSRRSDRRQTEHHPPLPCPPLPFSHASGIWLPMNPSPDELSIFRILDASANRAAEGLRTLEEYARFVLEDRGLTELAKSLRHDLTEALVAVPWRERLIARAVTSDCGTTVSTPQEGDRDGLQAVVAAAAARVQQALRCLEEYAKPIDPKLAVRAEALRYRAYSLAASLLLMRSRCERLADARLYLLISSETSEPSDSGDRAEEHFAATLRGLFSAGVDIIQLRDKAADDRRLYRLSRVGAEVARGLGKLFIVNDRADIARAAGAQGVHVGQDELPVEAVRRVVGSELLIGVSTHDVAQVRQSLADGADYIGCGPTFPGQTKGFAEYPGLGFLQAAAAETVLPAYAIGGITLDRLDEVLATGIHGVAVAHAILSAADPMAAARAWKDKM